MDYRNIIRRIRIAYIRVKLFIARLFKREKTVSLEEFKVDVRRMTKAQIIDEIIFQASRINKNDGQFKSTDRKDLRKVPKRTLEKSLILLKLYEKKPVRKFLEEENACS